MKKIKTSIEVMTEAEVQLIHESALKILAEVGINVPCEEMLNMVAEAGAVVDLEKENMKIPVAVMEKFLDKMRAESTFKIEETPTKLSGWISTQVSLVDYHTKERRYGRRDDILKGIKLVEHLKNIPAANAVVVPADVPYEVSDIVSFADIYKYSTKPGGTYILTPFSTKYVIELDKLFGRQPGYLFENISPLSYKKDTCEMAITFAKNGGGLGIAPMAMSSATAPVTVSGTLVIQTAEILSSIFIVHRLTGGYPGFAASCHSVDPKTMLCSFGSPNQALFGIAAAQMAKFYGIQGGTNTALTDSLYPDFQGGFEKGITAAFNNLSGACSIGCQGIVGADQGFSYEQLVIDNEWIDYYNYITSGFEVSPQSIGLDTIFDVGIKGNFLGEEHTVEYMRDSYWVSDIFGREDWANWVANGKKTILERAHDFVEEVTTDYKDAKPVISDSLCGSIDEIVAAAMAELNSLK